MSYKADVLKVMIASPSDVATERQMVRAVVHEWNDVHAEDKGIVLMPVGWDTHSSPLMGARPQEIINKHVLADADLLVAVFWTRIGSPTGDSVSGSVEEIERHIESGKPVMIYFSSSPVRPDSVDEDQYRRLKEFKKECFSRGLVHEYKSPAEFKNAFRRHLAHKVLSRFTATAIETEPVERQARTIPSLSEEAKAILVEASADEDGTVLRARSADGLSVIVNRRALLTGGSGRAEARWEAAVNELLALGFIADLGGKGEVFAITDEGYRIADLISQQ